jgi:4-diphosphocytidyl-2-C-methyl-D-erythritol kinase
VLVAVPTPVTVRAPAKVNLHLSVGDRRPDGYHELVTVYQALSVTDEITVAAAGEPGIEVCGQSAETVPTDERNLGWRALQVLAEHAGRDGEALRLTIEKSIPVAGGMAGGSADAAGALLGAAALWGLEMGRRELAELAGVLGSDVPFLLHGGTALGAGRGERVVPVLCRHTYHWVIAFDEGSLVTPAVYGELDRLRAAGRNHRVGEVEPVLAALASGSPQQLALLLGNDLQSALSLQPELRRTLEAGVSAGALAGMGSGSGPTCAFLCADRASAAEVAADVGRAGVCRAATVATGPVCGARLVTPHDGAPDHDPEPPEVYA